MPWSLMTGLTSIFWSFLSFTEENIDALERLRVNLVIMLSPRTVCHCLRRKDVLLYLPCWIWFARIQSNCSSSSPLWKWDSESGTTVGSTAVRIYWKTISSNPGNLIYWNSLYCQLHALLLMSCVVLNYSHIYDWKIMLFDFMFFTGPVDIK